MHPLTEWIEEALRDARAALRAHETLDDDLREAASSLEDALSDARRVLGGSHPKTVEIGRTLKKARAVLRAHGAQV